ncbi:MAG: universal stress protein [Dehalococcoidia bacterium]|nr:universal stress protein [Dehalococcoidia bacterium]
MALDSRPIVVPLDGSGNAESAIGPALKLARMWKAPVHLLHVVDPDTLRAAVNLDEATDAFKKYASGVVEREEGNDVQTTCIVVAGNAAEAILDAADSAQMVVIASHGRSGIHASLIGSVADKVVRGATVPTLVVPLGSVIGLGEGSVLIALDGSPSAEDGLTVGREIAAAFGQKVALVRAYSIPPPVGIEFVAYPVDLTVSLREGTEEYLQSVAKAGEDLYAVMSPAVDAIQDASERARAGLVIMTTRGKGLARRIVLGSTTDRAMRVLKRPLLIIPVKGD